MYSLQLKPTQLVWYGVVQDTERLYTLQFKPTQLIWYGVVQDPERLYAPYSSNLHSLCGMVWYRPWETVHLTVQTYTAYVVWCGTEHWETVCTLQFKPTQLMWYGVVQAPRDCTPYSSNLHSLCGMVWYRTLRDCMHLTVQTYTAYVVWCGTGPERLYAPYSSNLHSTACVVWCGTGYWETVYTLTAQTYTACVVWCGTGHWELTNSPHHSSWPPHHVSEWARPPCLVPALLRTTHFTRRQLPPALTSQQYYLHPSSV